MLSKIFLLAISFIALNAHAGLLLEPLAGYSIGNYKFTGTAANPDASFQMNTKAANLDGITYGGRAGLVWGNFFFGGEYQASRAQLKFDGMNESTSWNNQSVFGVLGVNIGWGLHVLAGMTVTPHVSELSTTPERTRYIGKAKKAGISYRYGVPIAVNVEYVMYEFDKYEIGTTKGDAKDLFSKMNYSAIMFSLSFPFEFALGGGGTNMPRGGPR